jgi:hypothetical protein
MIKTKIKILLSKLSPTSKDASRLGNCLFVHIPKTAGTSFRSGVEDKCHVINDYGINSERTSEKLKEEIYVQRNPFALKVILHNEPSHWIFGHVPLQKYIDFVPVLNTVSFVRSPLEQVVSHYNHFVSHYDFKGEIDDFIKKAGVLNVQHRLLAFLPAGLIGCLGITEEYEDSLFMLNHHLQTDFSLKTANVNAAKSISADNIDISLQKLILSKNQLDVALYTEARFLFNQRLQQLKEKKPWVYACVNVNGNNVVHGCAYFADKDDAVTLIVHLNNKEFKQKKAQEFYKEYTKANFPRQRYIGFRFDLPKYVSDKDSIDVYVEETGQKINYQPLKIPMKL